MGTQSHHRRPLRAVQWLPGHRLRVQIPVLPLPSRGTWQPHHQRHSPALRLPAPVPPPLGTALQVATVASWHKWEANGPSPMLVTTRPRSADPTQQSPTPDLPPLHPQPPQEPGQQLLGEELQRPPRRTPAPASLADSEMAGCNHHSGLWGPSCRCLCCLLCATLTNTPDAGEQPGRGQSSDGHHAAASCSWGGGWGVGLQVAGAHGRWLT